jgi:CheY-like chemotaxis protein
MERLDNSLDILYAEDCEEDFSLFLDAFHENGFSLSVKRVNNGQELVDYFLQENPLLPKLIISDLNMPRKNGFEAVREIRGASLLIKTPIIIFSHSATTENIRMSYDLGVNSFIQKPLSYQGHLECVKNIHNFWFRLAQLP